MSRTIRFHLDEHCDPAIAAGLRLHGVDVTTTPDVDLLGAEDEEHIFPLFVLPRTRSGSFRSTASALRPLRHRRLCRFIGRTVAGGGSAAFGGVMASGGPLAAG